MFISLSNRRSYTHLHSAVGRWQKGRDLSWYSKSSAPPTEAARQAARAEELRRIKEAEAEAMATALGLPVSKPVSNANAIPVAGEAREGEIKKVVDDLGKGDAAFGKGLGYGSYNGAGVPSDEDEVLSGTSRQRKDRVERHGKRQGMSRSDRRSNVDDLRDGRERRHIERRRHDYRDDYRDDRRDNLHEREIQHKHSRRRREHSRSRSRSWSRSRYERPLEDRRYRGDREPDHGERRGRWKNSDKRRRGRSRSSSSRRRVSDEERYRSYRRRSRSPRKQDERRRE